MGTNTSNRVEGKVDEVAGAIKKNVGRLIGNEQMELEGKLTEMKGVAEQASAKAGERVKGSIEELAGSAKNRVGELIGNEQMEVEGTLTALKGQARQKANQ